MPLTAERKPMFKIGGYGGFGVADLRSGYGNGTAPISMTRSRTAIEKV